MTNQRGVTLIELLVTITLMTIILTPILSLIPYTLTTQKYVSEHNQLQHEARFIMEYTTEKMREGASWDTSSSSLVATDGSQLLGFDATNNEVHLLPSKRVLSTSVTTFKFSSAEAGEDMKVKLTLKQGEHEYKLQTSIAIKRF